MEITTTETHLKPYTGIVPAVVRNGEGIFLVTSINKQSNTLYAVCLEPYAPYIEPGSFQHILLDEDVTYYPGIVTIQN